MAEIKERELRVLVREEGKSLTVGCAGLDGARSEVVQADAPTGKRQREERRSKSGLDGNVGVGGAEQRTVL